MNRVSSSFNPRCFDICYEYVFLFFFLSPFCIKIAYMKIMWSPAKMFVMQKEKKNVYWLLLLSPWTPCYCLCWPVLNLSEEEPCGAPPSQDTRPSSCTAVLLSNFHFAFRKQWEDYPIFFFFTTVTLWPLSQYFCPSISASFFKPNVWFSNF